MRRYIFGLATAVALASVSGAAAYVLQRFNSVVTPPARFCGVWTGKTIAVTDQDLRLVFWDRPEQERDVRVFDLPAAPVALEAWGDSLLVRMPGHPGRLLSPDFGGPSEYQTVPPLWHLPNASVDGGLYRVDVDLADSRFLVFTAPGQGSLIGMVDYWYSVGAAETYAVAADRVVLGSPSGVHVYSLANPYVPQRLALLAPPAPGGPIASVALRGRMLAVAWGDRIETWDLTIASAPVRLGTSDVTADQVALGDRWLAAWQSTAASPLVTVYDALAPEPLSVRGSFAAVGEIGAGAVQVQGDRLLLFLKRGLHCWTVPPGSGSLIDTQRAWVVLDGSLLASRDQTAWLQDDNGDRYVIDLAARNVVRRQPRAAVAHDFGTLAPCDGYLFYNPPGAGVHIESLADPLAPQVAAMIDRSPPIHSIEVSDGLLCATAGNELVLYDVTTPAAPVELGVLALPRPLHTLARVGQSLVVLSEREPRPAAAYLVDITDLAQPVLRESFTLTDAQDADWSASQVVARENTAVILCQQPGPGLSLVSQNLLVDLSDPQTPQWQWAWSFPELFWCSVTFDIGYGPEPQPSDPPLELYGLHVRYWDQDVYVSHNLPSGGSETVAIWTAPGVVQEIARHGNLLYVLTPGRLDYLTLSDPATVGVPAMPAASAVRAAPNPFNPQTELIISLPKAGPVQIDIVDGRGRRVRTLRSELPAGESRLGWDGTDQTGRALPSGVYLLRVAGPEITATGRCVLVR
jgi:hypothetical protein